MTPENEFSSTKRTTFICLLAARLYHSPFTGAKLRHFAGGKFCGFSEYCMAAACMIHYIS